MVIFKHNARENKHDYYNTVAPTNKKRAYSANKLEWPVSVLVIILVI